ncbi:MAG: response regulator [Bacteroides sp.]
MEQTTNEMPLVLVAEDDESNFKLIRAIIGKRCRLEWGRTGEELLKLYQQHKEEALMILMDIKMPIMTGLEATAKLRAEGCKLPIVVQTAYAFTSDRDKALEAGANNVLVKPITLTELRKLVKHYIPSIEW